LRTNGIPHAFQYDHFPHMFTIIATARDLLTTVKLANMLII